MNHCILEVTIQLLCGLVVCVAGSLNTTENPEVRLLADLFDNTRYNKNARPRSVQNTYEDITDVDVTLSFVAINDLNEKESKFTSILWLGMIWYDDNLVWDPNEYGGTHYFVIPAKDAWVPDIIFQNGAGSVHGDIIDTKKFRITVHSEGMVSYWTTGSISTNCNIDVSYFPFDDQVCSILLESWTYINESLLFSVSTSLDFDQYIENGQWTIISNKTTINNRYDKQFPRVSYQIHMRRKPLFMALTILLPCTILSFLACFVFYMPAESGEKTGFAITVFLSFTVFLLILTDSLPQTSDYVALSCHYTIFALAMSALSIPLTFLVLNLHHHDSENPPPYYVMYVILGILAPGLKKIKARKAFLTYKRIHIAQGNAVSDAGKKQAEIKDIDLVSVKDDRVSGSTVEKQNTNSDYFSLSSESDMGTEGLNQKLWVYLAEVLDLIFFVLYLFIVLMVTLYYFVHVPTRKPDLTLR